ncbi:hypothetical protein PV10_05857 [Exophiala mesophila]|uniref:Major facilitator superfamily (MFS) profile domain-containing protein n=1 Tax=Exophiala mesophila TaxID=212818 RepID=A0A0D1XT35_EXOME|nr:uncharacterized protein PV10_05857 [Exophiala mesophila]KIV91306.1 hypothetical protein PV10_05857 [Exophiala mesophila]
MGISKESPLVGVIVSVYYIGCAGGAVVASWFADRNGRRPGIFACLTTATFGNLLMFVAGLGELGHNTKVSLGTMLAGRIIMGLGVGGIDAVVPVYSSELSNDDARGVALAQEFQANILGLNMAFIVNLVATHQLGKSSQWAWRIPIIVMQTYSAILFAGANLLPETPRWLVMHDKHEKAKKAIARAFGSDQVESRITDLTDAHEQEQKDGSVSYGDMLWPSGSQFHPTFITVMGQVNQALTGYGAVSVYGPQIFQLLHFSTTTSEFLTLGNYLLYLLSMTITWLVIDRLGRRRLMLLGSTTLSISFTLLTILAGLAYHSPSLHISPLPPGIPGIILLYIATSIFGITWLVPPWLIPTEIYPSTARAQGAAISVVVWGLANFAVTLLTPIGFNSLEYFLLLVFAATNLMAGALTWAFCPETGRRSFEENQEFFKEAKDEKGGTWFVRAVKKGEFGYLPSTDGRGDGRDQEDDDNNDEDDCGDRGETRPLLGSSSH